MSRSTAASPTGPLAWAALAALLLAGAWLQPLLPAHALDWQPQRTGQAWRWWSAAFVHWSPGHRVANTVGLLLVALLGWRAGLPGRAAAAWLAAWPLTHLALLARPDLLHYGGLSGVLHAGVAVAGVAMVWPGSPRPRRRLGMALLAGLALKVLLEQPWGPALRSVDGWDIALAPLGHLSGALTGATCALLLVRRPR